MAIEIVDLPIGHGDLPEGITSVSGIRNIKTLLNAILSWINSKAVYLKKHKINPRKPV
jgi:hypothetical protein